MKPFMIITATLMQPPMILNTITKPLTTMILSTKTIPITIMTLIIPMIPNGIMITIALSATILQQQSIPPMTLMGTTRELPIVQKDAAVSTL